jgi:hypothetical protein
MNKPEFLIKDHLIYLDSLRESGITNMFGAAQYLTKAFPINIKEARIVLKYWMETFSERNK